MKGLRRTLLLALLAACADGQEPAAQLEPGGLITIAGVVLGAPEGALTAPITIRVEPAGAPAHTLEGLDPVGPFFAITAPETSVSAELLVGLPVPEEEAGTELAIAFLSSRATDGTGRSWFVQSGLRHADPLLELGTIASIPPDAGLTAVLVRAGAGRALRAAQTATSTFEVSCSARFLITGQSCTALERSAAEQALEAALVELRALGFRDPALARDLTGVALTIPPRLTYGAYEAELAPHTAPAAGQYDPDTRSMWIKLPLAGFNLSAHRTARHELFHAVQFAYPNTLSGWSAASAWVIEGSAAASEESSATMVRSPDFPLRGVAPSLLATTPMLAEYSAQDFWVYLGVRLNRGLDLLRPILDYGITPEDVHHGIASIGDPTFTGLGAAYEAWAQNQGYEHAVPLPEPGATVLQPQCMPDLPLPSLSYTGAPLPPHQVEIPPLATRVVEVVLIAPLAGYAARIEVSPRDPDVSVKIYDDAAIDCALEPEGPVRAVNVAAGTLLAFHVLIANTGVVTRQVEIEISRPRVSVVPPVLALRARVGESATGTFAIHNHGMDRLLYTAMPRPAITTSTSGAIAPMQTTTATVHAACTQAGTFAAELELGFTTEAGAPVADVPPGVHVDLECTGDCQDGLAWSGSFDFSLIGMCNEPERTARFSVSAAGSGMMSGFGGTYTLEAAAITAGFASDSTSGETTVREVGAALRPSSTRLVLHVRPQTCSYGVEVHVILEGELITTSPAGDSRMPVEVGFHAWSEERPMTGRTLSGSTNFAMSGARYTLGTNIAACPQIGPPTWSWSFTW